jgi:hypothetical protein
LEVPTSPLGAADATPGSDIALGGGGGRFSALCFFEQADRMSALDTSPMAAIFFTALLPRFDVKAGHTESIRGLLL